MQYLIYFPLLLTECHSRASGNPVFNRDSHFRGNDNGSFCGRIEYRWSCQIFCWFDSFLKVVRDWTLSEPWWTYTLHGYNLETLNTTLRSSVQCH